MGIGPKFFEFRDINQVALLRELCSLNGFYSASLYFEAVAYRLRAEPTHEKLTCQLNFSD